MYDLIYDQMIYADIVVEFPEEEQYWVNKYGEELDSDDNVVRLKVKIKLLTPSCCYLLIKLELKLVKKMMVMLVVRGLFLQK